MIAFAPIYPLFTMFSWPWWVVTGFMALFILTSLLNESYVTAGALAGVTLFAFVVFGDLRPSTLGLHHLVEHPYYTIGILGSYFALGAAWGLFKWYLFVTKKREEYDDYKAQFLANKGLHEHASGGVIPIEMRQEWTQFLRYDHRFSDSLTVGGVKLRPYAREHKGQLLYWMSMWPVSMLSSIFSDFIKGIFNRIRRVLHNVMESISIRAFRGTENDIEMPENPKLALTGEKTES